MRVARADAHIPLSCETNLTPLSPQDFHRVYFDAFIIPAGPENNHTIRQEASSTSILHTRLLELPLTTSRTLLPLLPTYVASTIFAYI